MADCAYTFTGPDGKPLTIVGVPGLKAYLVDGGLEHLFPERKFPLKAVARFSRQQSVAELEEAVKKYASEVKYDKGPDDFWLKNKIEFIKSFGRDEFGVPRMGPATAYFNDNKPVMVPIEKLVRVRGMRGEQDNVRQSSLDWLKKRFRDTGKLPTYGEDNKTDYPFIQVGYDGVPWVNEGNHRIMAAYQEGIKALPVTVTYHVGGEESALDHWKPEALLQWQKEVFDAKMEEAKSRSTESRFSREGIGATINVDGVERPTTNSTGQLIHQTEDGIRNFWKWFGGSKVVDSEGRPLVVYHGTQANISQFMRGQGGYAYFTSSDKYASKFAGTTEGANVIPVYLKLSTPVDLTSFGEEAISKADFERELSGNGVSTVSDYENPVPAWRHIKSDGVKWDAADSGVDGFVFKEGNGVTAYAVFEREQIKSAIGNQGSFSPEDADIRYSATEKPTRKNTFKNQAAAEDHLLQSFGPGIKNLISSNVLNFTQGKASWPDAVQRQLRGGEEAVYVNGKAYIDLQAIGKDRLNAVVLHEIGEHFNLKLMLGPEGYKSLQDQITNRAKIKGSQAEKIWNQVERLYPDLEVGSEAFVSEVIAKLGEANPQAPWYRRLLTRIKAFLVERGLGRGFITGTMTEDDMHDLLRTSLMSAAGRFAQGEARVFGEEVMASVPGWHGTPHEVERFRTEKIGTGEGAQAFGYGLYFTSAKRIAEWYRDKLTTDTPAYSTYKGEKITKDSIARLEKSDPVAYWVFNYLGKKATGAWHVPNELEILQYHHENEAYRFKKYGPEYAKDVARHEKIADALKSVKEQTAHFAKEKNTGNLYQVELVPEQDEFLDWDKPLSEQSEKVKEGLKSLPNQAYLNVDKGKGESLYVRLKTLTGSPESASAALHEVGIRGITYKAEGGKSDENNYVIFHEDDVTIVGRFSRPIENLQPAPEERTPLWSRWFGKSKMQRGGEPIKFYHGSQAEFTVFDKNRLATNTTHTTAGLGHFFTMRKEEAKSYGGNVKEVFLSIQKPYVTFSWSLDSKFKDAEGAAKFREKLISEGYDGVYIKDAGYAVTFESNQAKLTENERPTFGEDVRFSRIGTVEDGETYEEAFWRDNQPSVLQLMKEKMEDATDAARKIMLAGLGVNHMIEIMSNSLPTLKALGRSIQLRETAKMDIIREADSIVVDAKNNLDNTVRARLNRVINESTDVDADASLAWRGIESSEGKGTGTTVYTVHTQANLSENYKNAANLAAISLGLKPSKSTGKAFVRNRATFTDRAKAEAFLAELQKIEQRQSVDTSNAKLNKTNQKRKAEHAKLYSALMTLGEEPIRLYRAMNAQHTSVMEQQLEEITARIKNAISDRRLRSEMIANTRRAFEDNSLQWYYAPLTRFGDYWFYGTIEKDGEIEHWREHFNSEKALNRKIALFEKKGGKLIGRGKRLQNIEQFGSVGAADSYVADIQSKIAQHLDVNDPAVQQLQDSIYQFHLSTLPDVSIRHSRQHRKGVKGAETDAFKSFSDKMHHASTQLANMKYGAEIAEIMTDHQEMKKLWENSNYLKSAEAKVEAIKLLQDDWDTIAKPGELEALRDKAEIDKDFEKFGIYKEAINVRNKFGGALRDQLDKDGKVIGQIGSEGYEVEEGLARLKDRTEKHVTGAKNIQDKDKTLAADVIDELLKSVDAMMKTQTTDIDRWAMKLSALNFTGMMGFGVSSALVNIVQTPGVAAPVIGARYGFAKTMATLNKTASWFLKAAFNGLKDEDGNISITGYLLAEYEKASAAGDSAKAKELMAIHDALDTFKKDGTIGRTQTFDLLGVAQDGLGSSSIFFDIAKKGGFMFHHAERFNREVTLAAAYLLSKNDTARTPRQEGESDTAYKKRVDEAAIDYARWANERAHLNYSAEVAARIFRGPVARISMQFRKYTHGMMFLWGKALHDMLATIKKEDFPTAEAWEAAKEAKLEARRTFLGLLFMQTSFAGAMGLPMMGTLGIAYSLLAGDDDDIPADLERDLTAILIKWFGEDIGYGLARGFIDKATPVALSTRLDLKDIYFREPLKEMEGRDEGAAYALQVLGPTGGSFLNAWQGLSDMAKGDVLKGGEKLLPKAVGDILKAYRLGTEGATTRQGDHIKDMKAMEVMLQGIGFGSSELQRYYVESGFAKSAEDSLEKARQSVVSKIGRAMATGGEADTDLVDAWNEKHPEWPIRYQDLAASAKRVTSNIEERSEKGYLLNPKLEYLREEYDFFSDEDED